VRRLLSHSAGLSIDGFPGYAPGQPLPTLPQILDGQKPANTGAVRPTAWPGLQYRYSGGGYEVLELLMTDVTGQRLPELVKQRVLDPIGMQASTYDRGAADGDYANGYKGDGRPVAGGAFVYPELAAAGLWTTPTDIARLGAALQQALRGGAMSPVVSQATASLMLSEQMKPGGLGFQLRDGATRWFLHSGMNEGFQSFALFNTAGDGVVVMTNADTGLILAYEIIATLARAYGWTDYLPEERPSITLTADALREYAGTYPTERFGTIVVEARDDRLIVRTESRPPIEFFPESSRLFFPETHGLKAKFNRGWFGGVSSISFGRLVVAKGSNAPPAPARTN
jgi:CubicO group peptidase (beta-lactamase class C family)